MSKRVNRDDIDKFHDYSLYIPTRTIYMGSESYGDDDEGGVDGMLAERMVKNLIILNAISSAPINLIINNVGGDEYHCFAIYDAIKTSAAPVIATVFGHAMSAGSMVLQAASERIMAPTSRQMIHYGTWGCNDHAKNAQKQAKEGEKIDKWMEHMYLDRIKEKHPQYKLEDVQLMLNFDTYLTAKESVKIGLADKILGDK